jgi:hypothetical protein
MENKKQTQTNEGASDCTMLFESGFEGKPKPKNPEFPKFDKSFIDASINEYNNFVNRLVDTRSRPKETNPEIIAGLKHEIARLDTIFKNQNPRFYEYINNKLILKSNK